MRASSASESEAFKGSAAGVAKGFTADAGEERVIESLTSERDGLRKQVNEMRELMEEMRETMLAMKRMQRAESTASDTAVAKQSVESTASDPSPHVADESTASESTPANIAWEEEGKDTMMGSIEEVDDVARITTTQRRWVSGDSCSVKLIDEKQALSS